MEHHSTWPGAKEKEEEKAAPCCGTLKLFTTRTCPNCAMAKEQLNSIGLVYEVIDAEEHPELAMQYSLRQAPTLIVEKDGEVQKFSGIANVLKFVDAQQKSGVNKKIMIPRQSRGYFLNGQSPMLPATPHAALVRSDICMGLLPAARKRA